MEQILRELSTANSQVLVIVGDRQMPGRAMIFFTIPFGNLYNYNISHISRSIELYTSLFKISRNHIALSRSISTSYLEKSRLILSISIFIYRNFQLQVYLLQMLSYCCSSADLSRFGACYAALRGLARHDQLWRLAWHCRGLPRVPPETQVAPKRPGERGGFKREMVDFYGKNGKKWNILGFLLENIREKWWFSMLQS